eukprot:comp19728_c0_seq1/m.23514 comp19728_c0_seq1/g.23514  ORF comp19728_c0_seq1/g.23514 comp19728_c0_seq1/m.23514 type:complete len:241 (-) comp19728_c0_seq1:720-1442(-)
MEDEKPGGILPLAQENKVVVPGDVLGKAEGDVIGQLQLGPGLRLEGERVVVCRPGVLRYRGPNKYWVDSNYKRYVPVKDERVVGIVTDRLGENYKVDIGTAQMATLDSLAFEGVTKRNRPNLQPGALVYARVSVADPHMEPQLVCVDSNLKASGMGELVGGYLVHCSLGLVRQLLASKCAVLTALGKEIPFEVAVGVNGRVWIRAKALEHTVVVANAIRNSEFMTDTQTQVMVRKLIQAL